jgi:alpha-D-ribose 1-methylphosphonate 5-triphosphate synthase subunit PhnH
MILPVKEAFDLAYDTQRVFRLLLDSMARPGKINYLPDIKLLIGKENSFPYLIARTLLDTEVTFTCLDINDEPNAKDIFRCTGARSVDVEHADFIFCDGRRAQGELALAHPGTTDLSETGTTVVMVIDHLYGQPPGSYGELIRLELSGPGVNGATQLWLSGMHRDNIGGPTPRSHDYHLGTDTTILVDLEGKIACLPRSSRPAWDVESDGPRYG